MILDEIDQLIIESKGKIISAIGGVIKRNPRLAMAAAAGTASILLPTAGYLYLKHKRAIKPTTVGDLDDLKKRIGGASEEQAAKLRSEISSIKDRIGGAAKEQSDNLQSKLNASTNEKLAYGAAGLGTGVAATGVGAYAAMR